MRPVTLPHNVMPQSHFCSSAKDPYPSSYTVISTTQVLISYGSPQHLCPVFFQWITHFKFFLLIFPGVRIFLDYLPLHRSSVKYFAPLGGLRSMGSGLGYPSARDWARECEAKRPPNAGTKLSHEKDPYFPQKAFQTNFSHFLRQAKFF